MKRSFATLFLLSAALWGGAAAVACDPHESCERTVKYACPTITNPGRMCKKTVNDPTCLARRAACHVEVPQPRPPTPEQIVHISNNIAERQGEIRHRYNSVIWSKHFDYAEYVKFASAIAAAVASENPGPVEIYLKELLAEMKQQLIRNGEAEGREIARRLGMRLLVQAVNAAVNGGPMPRLDLGHVRIVPGKVMYDHWKDITLRIPEVHGTTVKWHDVHNRQDLPHTFQLYIGVDY